VRNRVARDNQVWGLTVPPAQPRRTERTEEQPRTASAPAACLHHGDTCSTAYAATQRRRLQNKAAVTGVSAFRPGRCRTPRVPRRGCTRAAQRDATTHVGGPHARPLHSSGPHGPGRTCSSPERARRRYVCWRAPAAPTFLSVAPAAAPQAPWRHRGRAFPGRDAPRW